MHLDGVRFLRELVLPTLASCFPTERITSLTFLDVKRDVCLLWPPCLWCAVSAGTTPLLPRVNLVKVVLEGAVVTIPRNSLSKDAGHLDVQRLTVCNEVIKEAVHPLQLWKCKFENGSLMACQELDVDKRRRTKVGAWQQGSPHAFKSSPVAHLVEARSDDLQVTTSNPDGGQVNLYWDMSFAASAGGTTMTDELQIAVSIAVNL